MSASHSLYLNACQDPHGRAPSGSGPWLFFSFKITFLFFPQTLICSPPEMFFVGSFEVADRIRMTFSQNEMRCRGQDPETPWCGRQAWGRPAGRRALHRPCKSQLHFKQTHRRARMVNTQSCLSSERERSSDFIFPDPEPIYFLLNSFLLPLR